MAIGTTAAIIGAGALAAGSAFYGSKKAADAQKKAASKSTDTQLEMYYQSRQDMAPWREAGEWALGGPGGKQFDPQRYLEMYPDVAADPYYGSRPEEHYQRYGMAEGRQGEWETPANGLVGMIQQGPGEFTESPGYQFTLSEGQRGIQNALSSMGQNRSGKHLKSAARYAENLASTEYDNFLRRWYQSLNPYQSLAGVGQTSAAQTAASGANAANQVSNAQLYSGQAQAAGTINQANALTGAITGGANQLLYYNALRNLPQQNPAGWMDSYRWSPR